MLFRGQRTARRECFREVAITAGCGADRREARMDARTLSLLTAGGIIAYLAYLSPAIGVAVAVGAGVAALLHGLINK